MTLGGSAQPVLPFIPRSCTALFTQTSRAVLSPASLSLARLTP